jgi:hypothetical protein
MEENVMKSMKVLIVLLVVLLACCFVLTACPKKGGSDNVDRTVTESDQEEVLKQLKMDVKLPANAEEVEYSILDKSIAQIDFRIDGDRYIVRISSGKENDISDGLAVIADVEEKVTVRDTEFELKYTEDEDGMAIGYDAKAKKNYVFLIMRNCSKDKLVDIINAIML